MCQEPGRLLHVVVVPAVTLRKAGAPSAPAWRRGAPMSRCLALIVLVLAACDEAPPDKNTAHLSAPDDLLQRLSNVREYVRIGQVDGGTEYTFGESFDAVVLDEQLILLDPQFSAVKVFSKEGAFRTAAGTAGTGPNEFVAPLDVFVLKGRLRVIDGNGRITKLNVQNAELVFEGSQQLEFSAREGCEWGNNYILQGLDTANGDLLHEFDGATGTRIRSWHKVPRGPPVFQAQAAFARTACGTTAVATVGSTDSLVYVYGSATDEPLLVKVPSFAGLRVRTRPSGAVETSLPEGRSHYTVNDALIALSANAFLLQVGQYTRNGDRQKIDSYLIDSRGEVTPIAADLPLILDASEHALVGALSELVPQLVVLEW